MSNGHIPPVRNPGPTDVDWSQAPEGATHFCTRQNLWYRKDADGTWHYMEPFNEKYGWHPSNLAQKQLKDLVPRPTSVGPEIDWSQAPEGATHYLPGRQHPWRRLIGGLVHVWLPPTGWVVTSTIGPLAQQSRGVLSEEGIPRPAGKVICSECHGNGFVRDHSVEEMMDHKCCATCAGGGEVDPTKAEGTSEKAEQAERPETYASMEARALGAYLPDDWFTLPPWDRKAALMNEAGRLIKSPIDSDKYKPVLVGLLEHLVLKRLVDVSDSLYDQTRAMVAVRMAPELAGEEAISWTHIDVVAQQLIGGGAPEMTVGKAYAELASEQDDKLHEQAVAHLDRRQFPAPGYERLHDVYVDAHHQAAYGKGNERHANDLPFHEQRMQTISQGLNSPDGMAYQVIKKVQEGLQMKDAGARRRELLGALNYLAGIVIFLDDREAGGDV